MSYLKIEVLEATLKKYYVMLFIKLLWSIALVSGLGILYLMSRELVSLNGISRGFPTWFWLGIVIFVAISILELLDFAAGSKQCNVPISWIIQAEYDLGWDVIQIIFIENFAERFTAEMDKKGLKYKIQ